MSGNENVTKLHEVIGNTFVMRYELAEARAALAVAEGVAADLRREVGALKAENKVMRWGVELMSAETTQTIDLLRIIEASFAGMELECDVKNARHRMAVALKQMKNPNPPESEPEASKCDRAKSSRS